jgi:16S rRNA processing protein RimM
MAARAQYDPDTLLVGKLGRPHGLAGEVVLHAYNTQGTGLDGVAAVILELDGKRSERTVRAARRTAAGWLLHLGGVDSREAAAALTHAEVRVPRSALPPLGAGEYFVEDVVGCSVVLEDGRAVGVVDSVFWNGAHDVMVVVGEGTPAPERLVPLVPTFVRDVDAAGRRLVIAWEDEA